MVKPRGALKKGRAADGKLNSHLQWPKYAVPFAQLVERVRVYTQH